MNRSDWKPGDAALVTGLNGDMVVAVWSGWHWQCATATGGINFDVEPQRLVLIELPNGALAGWSVLIDALKTAREKSGYNMVFSDLIAQIERQTQVPKPPEPTGLGAVVEDADGVLWTRFTREYDYDAVWSHETSRSGNRTYASIAAIKVLTPGIPTVEVVQTCKACGEPQRSASNGVVWQPHTEVCSERPPF